MAPRPAPKWVRVGATAVAVIAVAEVAAWILRPRDVIEPAQVDEGSYFTAAELERTHDYRSTQRLLAIGGLLAEGGVLVLLVAGRPRWGRRALERAGARPVIGGAAAAAGIVLLVELGGLPFAIAAHERAVDAGLSTQSLGEWGFDAAKATAVSVVIAAGVGTAALALIRRSGSRWWIPGSAALVGFAAVMLWVAPVVLAPLFNKFDRLEQGQARSDVLELAGKAGVDVGEVYRVDASRQTTGLNAYVSGLGSTKRVVLYDNLLEALDRGERRSVIAHELSHAENQDVPRGLLWVALVSPLAMLLTTQLASSFSARESRELGTPAALPALALALAIVSFGVGVLGNRLSREVEAKADTRALELTDDPQALIRLQREVALRNLGDPDPPELYQLVFGTHPSTVERIGAALAWERGERP